MGVYDSKRWLIAAAIAGTALGASASAPAPTVAASDYKPMPRSTLVSRGEPTFVQARVRRGEQWVTVLARNDPAGAPVPVAVTTSTGDGAGAHVSVQVLPDGGSRALKLLVREHLYALMLRQDAQSRYCLAVGARPCDAARRSVSHDVLLRALAGERHRAAVGADIPFATVPWRSVSMRASAAAATDPDEVTVRVADNNRPMAGATVHFNRAPHSSCVGRAGANGMASCRLIDQHGDEGSHDDEDENSQVIVTYPGDVRADRVFLPTTFVLPARGS
jgi:hypothetical protein